MKARISTIAALFALTAGLLCAQQKAGVQMEKLGPIRAGGPIAFTVKLDEPLPKGARFDLRISPISADEEIDLGSGEPKHYATARSWLAFPPRSISMDENFIKVYFDVQNSQAMWLELANLVQRIEADLTVALEFKNQEPKIDRSSEGPALNDLHYIHTRKMEKLDHAVHGLIKVQDLVNRLLHESLGGDLVDTSDPDWEKDGLKRKKVIKGLNRKLADGTIAQVQFDAISDALQIPEKHPKKDTALTYRNRLAHGIRPSVDYPMFFTWLESRRGEELKDARGTVIGKRHVMRVRAPADYSFRELHASLIEYLDAVVEMLDRLNRIDLLRKYGEKSGAAGAA